MKVSVNGVYKEIEDVKIEVPVEFKIMELKQNLKDTDYLSLKHHEGELTDEEFEPIKLQRKVWRDEINKLESEEISK